MERAQAWPMLATARGAVFGCHSNLTVDTGAAQVDARAGALTRGKDDREETDEEWVDGIHKHTHTHTHTPTRSVSRLYIFTGPSHGLRPS